MGVILPIQYLRGVAALMVAWHHGVGQLPGLEAHFPLRFGTSGVDLFFVISGFIMVRTTAGKSVMPGSFIARRLVRVVPLYWALTLALVAAILVAPSIFRTTVLTPTSLVQSLLFIPHLSPSHAGMVWPVLVPGWTLNYEMFFYAVFAASLAFQHRLAALASTLAVLVAVGYVLGPFANPIARTYTDPILLEFVAGAVIGQLWIDGRLKLPMSVSLIGALIGAALLMLRDAPPLASYTQLLGAVLVVIGTLNMSRLNRQNDVLRALGDASYSIYLTHIFALGAWRWAWAKAQLDVSSLPMATLFMVSALVFCALVGWLTFLFLETPLLDRLNALLRKRLANVVPVTNARGP